jgi:hypothetical protein
MATFSVNNNAVLIAAAERILAKDTYKRQIQELQGCNGMLADKITLGGHVEQALLLAAGEGENDVAAKTENDEEDVKESPTVAFLREQRQLLKQVAHDSIVRERQVECFMGAVREICNEAKAVAASGGGRSGGGADADSNEEAESDEAEADAVDYSAVLKQKIEKLHQQQQHAAVTVEIDDETHCKDIRQRLGEKEKKKKRKTGRRSRGGTEQYESEEEEELEIVNTAAATQAAGGGVAGGQAEDNTIKCPITAMLFQQPMKNKVCGHTYSQAGVDQMIKMGKRKCPIPGCANNQLSERQLEADVEMELKVKRHVRRVAHEEEKRRTAQASDDDGEEEFDDNDEDQAGAGVTMVH